MRISKNIGSMPGFHRLFQAERRLRMAAGKARILLGSVRQAYTRLFAILSGHDLQFVSTLAAARDALEGNAFDLIMIGIHFDESRMFELLHSVRADKRYAEVPVICFRGIAMEDSQIGFSLDAVEAACTAAKANAFFDLTAVPDDASGNSTVRNLIDRVLHDDQSSI
jgi:CheY-like chemotaxis protein